MYITCSSHIQTETTSRVTSLFLQSMKEGLPSHYDGIIRRCGRGHVDILRRIGIVGIYLLSNHDITHDCGRLWRCINISLISWLLYHNSLPLRCPSGPANPNDYHEKD